MAHTPGPWEWEASAYEVYSPADMTSVCMCCGHEDVEANARLIAAAPELLEALKDCIELIREEYSSEESIAMEGHPIERKARKVWDAGWEAIAKAIYQ